MLKIKTLVIVFLAISLSLNAAEASDDNSTLQVNEQHDDQGHTHAEDGDHTEHTNACGFVVGETEFNPGKTAFHHISDQNIYSIGPWHFPLPCFLYAKGEGWDVFSSSKFHADYHGTGEYAYNKYVIYEGAIRRITDPSFPDGLVELEGHGSLFTQDIKDQTTGKDKTVVFLCHEGQVYQCDSKSYADGGLLGGGMSSFYDFSITKNVAAMLIVFLLLAWMFISIARAYTKRDGKAPSGLQGFMEPIFVFIQDEVAKPFLGHKWEVYLPFIMSLFFFILGLNLFGQVPFFGGSNVTGNLSFTLVLAVFAFLVTNLSGNKHYWGHTLWMPGVPTVLKVLIITPVEIMGLFIKPLTLMLRLFGNITAGHMVIVIFVGLIFIFGQNGANPAAAWGTTIGSTLLTLFMMAIELLVAFIQAFVFAILVASYIGAATEEAHH
jgi:F-type H+-transporting ATPase subunit a